MLSADTRQKQRLATSLTYTPISPPLSTGFQTNQDCKLHGGGRIAGAASIASLATDECEDGQAIPPTFVGSSCREPVKESKASHLAVQLDGASQLLGSFAAGPQAVWRRVEVDGIQPYYWNEETGVSSWSRPDVPKPRSEDLPRVELDELTKPWIEDRVCSKGDGALPSFSEISKSKTPLWKQPLPTRTFPLMSRTKRLEPARKDPSPSKAAGLKDGAKPSSDETDDSTLGPSGLPESSTSPPPSRGKSQPSDAPASALGSSATPRSPSQNQTAAPPAPRQQSPKKPKPASARRGGKLHEELESKLSELREDDEEMQKLRSRSAWSNPFCRPFARQHYASTRRYHHFLRRRATPHMHAFLLSLQDTTIDA
eukprot:6200789-Pleurochrysis_carterae.AAC.2